MYQRRIVDLTPVELNRLVHQIGNTPIQPIYLVIKGRARKVYLKLEGANPTGSVKDRTGHALIHHLEDRGILNKGSVIVESTSGNLGVALALLCKAKGYGFIAVVDPKTTQENIIKMQTLGAQIDMVRQPDVTGGYLLSRLARVQELCHLSNAYIWTDQYSNPANPYIHYTHTGPEIYRQMNGKVDAVFVPVSTGGTLAGIGRFFRKVSPSTCIIGVDAYGSVVFDTPAAPRKLTGIGSSRPSSFISNDLYDTYMLVKDEEAFALCRTLYAATDIKVGGSSGAVLAACAQYLLAHPHVTNVVCVCADNGENYASSIFNDEWVQQQGLNLSGDRLGWVQDIVRNSCNRIHSLF
jgi:2,3-diaminopropionate biosynthesis protein SbnA